jgi:hypothetical protein
VDRLDQVDVVNAFSSGSSTPSTVSTLSLAPLGLDSTHASAHEKEKRRRNPMYKFFSSQLPPSELISKLPEFTDSKKIDPSRHSLYEGEKEIIAQVKGTRFTAEKRQKIGWGLAWFSPGFWFKPVLTGSVTPLKEGSAVIFEGGTPVSMKVLWAVLIVIIAQVGGIFLLFDYPVNINFDGLHADSTMFATIAAINTAIGILLLIPFIGWWLTRNDLAFVAAAVERHLQLQPAQKSSVDWLLGV